MIQPTEQQLSAALGVRRWVGDVLAAAPYATIEALLIQASDSANPLSPEEIDEALTHHPRIGDQPIGNSAEAEFSRREQESADDEDAHLARKLAKGNADYESKFGRLFLIRAAGRSRAEILAELHRRLSIDPANELQIVGEQLREIALLRLEKTFVDGTGA